MPTAQQVNEHKLRLANYLLYPAIGQTHAQIRWHCITLTVRAHELVEAILQIELRCSRVRRLELDRDILACEHVLSCIETMSCYGILSKGETLVLFARNNNYYCAKNV